MRRTVAGWSTGVIAGAIGTLMGCGGSSESEPEYAPIAAAPAPTAAAPLAMAPAPAAAPEQTSVVATPNDTSADIAASPAAGGLGAQRRSPDAAATDDLLALAKSAPVAGPPGSATEVTSATTESAGQGPGPNSGGYGGMRGAGSMPSNYPGMGGQGQPDGYAAQRNQGMPSGYPGAGGATDDGYAARSGRGQAGASGYPGAGGPTAYPGSGEGGYGAAGGRGGAGTGTSATPDFSNPIKGAETFLAAAKARDPHLLSDSVALRAAQEAEPKTRPYFVKILEGPQSIDEDLLNLLEDALKDMQIVGTNRVSSTARLGVIVSRQNDAGDEIRRTITMRKEKAGWKVADISGPAIIKAPAQMRNRTPGGQGGAGGASGRP